MAMKMMVTQVANEGRTPFDGLFGAPATLELAEDVRRDMVYAEALELGLITEERDGDDPTRISASVLEELGVSPEEVGQQVASACSMIAVGGEPDGKAMVVFEPWMTRYTRLKSSGP